MKLKLEITKAGPDWNYIDFFNARDGREKLENIIYDIREKGWSDHCPMWFDEKFFRIANYKVIPGRINYINFFKGGEQPSKCSVCAWYFPKIAQGVWECPCYLYSAETLILFLEKILREGGLELELLQ